jgi:hypothetical protein
MKPILKAISFAGLALMFVASILVFEGSITQHSYRLVAIVGTALWFCTVPFWMKRRLHHSE